MLLNIKEYNDDNIQELVDFTNEVTGNIRGMLPRRTVYGSEEARELGLLPFSQTPTPQEKWQSVIEYCHNNKIFPMYWQEPLGYFKGWSQNGLGYCWAWSLTACVIGTRAVEGQRPVLLGPASLGYSVNWRNAGNYMDKAIGDAARRGIAPQDYLPSLWNINPNSYKPGWEREALKYRPAEWWDINTGVSATLIIGQCLSVLSVGRPLYVGYNWWGHAVECVGLSWEPGKLYNVGFIIQNSHGEDAPIKLTGSKMVPDEAYGIRAISWAD